MNPMKVAVVYNRESQRVINLFGIPNREKYGLKAIRRITEALKKGGHQVKAFEGDKDLIDNLEHFMPRVIKGELPGMVFNLSYGIQGQARYTHVPSILEMVGIPYVGSGPLAHSLALDKVVAKMLFQQHGLPTPDFVVLHQPDAEKVHLEYPLIVKPKNEAVSFGLTIVYREEDLRRASRDIIENYGQPALVERYIEGREINVGLLGNENPEIFQPVEIIFGPGGPPIFTYEDKMRVSHREIQAKCPAEVGQETTLHAQELAYRAFKALGCSDCARVDMRLDLEGRLYLLEINSLPSLSETGSYVVAAQQAGLDFPKLVNRLVEVAGARYFGTPAPLPLTTKPSSAEELIFSFITQKRDRIEERLSRWIELKSRTHDLVGIRKVQHEIQRVFGDVGLKPVSQLIDEPSVWTWETKAGLNHGTLLIAAIDHPLAEHDPEQPFRREPERLFGEGIGSTRAPLTMIEFILRALDQCKLLNKRRIGVLLYADEGHDCRYSGPVLRQAIQRAARVLVFRPSIQQDSFIVERRGQRLYRFVVEGKSRRVDKTVRAPDAFRWASSKLLSFSELSSVEQRLSIAAIKVDTESFPLQLPHRVTATVSMTYTRQSVADEAEAKMRQRLVGKEFEWDLELISDRPPLGRHRASLKIVKDLIELAKKWDISLNAQTSAIPSVAGLVPASIPVVCGVGPVVYDLYTPSESIDRLSVLQRTLLVAQYLARIDET